MEKVATVYPRNALVKHSDGNFYVSLTDSITDVEKVEVKVAPVDNDEKVMKQIKKGKRCDTR